MQPSTVRRFAGIFSLLALLATSGVLPTAQAAPAAPPAKGAKPPKKNGAVKRAEAILGKPLTPAQQNAVKAAAKIRQTEMKAVTTKFQTAVAKTLGISLAQYQAKDKAIKDKEKANKKP